MNYGKISRSRGTVAQCEDLHEMQCTQCTPCYPLQKMRIREPQTEIKRAERIIEFSFFISALLRTVKGHLFSFLAVLSKVGFDIALVADALLHPEIGELPPDAHYVLFVLPVFRIHVDHFSRVP